MSDQLIIAGFHRSGTSATAQLLHRAGLFLGDELLEANSSNPYGHFEDREVVDLHQKILTDNGLTWQVTEPFLPVVNREHWDRMRDIVDRRNSEHGLWGFKDPRSCMFMMLWKYLMPDSKTLIVYRHFSESTHSLSRRHSYNLFTNKENSSIHQRFWEEPDLALRMWLAHNEALLTFAREYPEDTIIISLDRIRDGFPIVRAINQRWRLQLRDLPISEVFDPALSGRRVERQPVSDLRLIPKVESAWSSLEESSKETELMFLEEAVVAGE